MDKRGQGLSTNAIILIILGVVVLVVLVIGFTIGWDKIAPWISSNNVNAIVQQCEVACSTGSVYDYCSMKRELNDGKDELKDVTCYWLSMKREIYGVKKCPSDLCSSVIFEECGGGINAGKSSQVFNLDTKTLEHSNC